MGAAVNGMAAHGGVIPYSATFLVFSDYMKPAIRLGALSGLHAVYVFTHDSIGVGEDGPTHEPVEHLAGLRAIPNLSVIRPGDANEAVEGWVAALEADGWADPLLLLAPEPGNPRSVGGARASTAQGAYILSDAEGGTPDVILIGTGSEIGLCVGAAEKLAEFGVRARVVSMPSWDLFAAQDQGYRDSVLPPRYPQARDGRGGGDVRLGALGRDRWRDDRPRSLRRIGPRRPDHEGTSASPRSTSRRPRCGCSGVTRTPTPSRPRARRWRR